MTTIIMPRERLGLLRHLQITVVVMIELVIWSRRGGLECLERVVICYWLLLLGFLVMYKLIDVL